MILKELKRFFPTFASLLLFVVVLFAPYIDKVKRPKPKGAKYFLPTFVSLLLCAVVFYTPYIVLYILLSKYRLITVSYLLAIKAGTGIWNILCICVVAPKINKKIKKLFEAGPNSEQVELAAQIINEPGAKQETEDQKVENRQ